MHIRHCKSCHHEWATNTTTCDWCGAEGIIIGDDREEFNDILMKDLLNAIKKKHERLKNG